MKCGKMFEYKKEGFVFVRMPFCLEFYVILLSLSIEFYLFVLHFLKCHHTWLGSCWLYEKKKKLSDLHFLYLVITEIIVPYGLSTS